MSNDPTSIRSRKSYSTVVEHLAETDHRADINTAFKSLYGNFQDESLRFVNASVTGKFELPLFAQKNLS